MAQLLRTLRLSHPPFPLSSSSLLTPNKISKLPSLFSSPFTTNTLVNFTPPGSESDSEPETQPTRHIEREVLPPPYDPFRKGPAIAEPDDPKNLPEVFHKMRSDGLFNNAVKMFDELSQQGFTHLALELFKEIKDKGKMPDVVAHTAVIEAYANAGQSKEAHKVFLRMLSSGVMPNIYTYSVLIKSLSVDRKLGEVKKYVLEMLEKDMRPNARVCSVVFEAFVMEGMVEQGKEFLKEMKEKGFMVDDKGIREVLKGKRGSVFRAVLDILLAK